MQHFFNFIVKYKYFLLFLLLEFFALTFTILNHSYHKSIFINSSNGLTGGILARVNSIDNYLNLDRNNQLLLQENTKLKNELEHFKTVDKSILDSSKTYQKFEFIAAKVIRNDYTSPNNYLTLNKGLDDSVAVDMGLINEKGVLGIVNHVTTHYATAISILNQKSKINVKLKTSDYFGSLIWNGNNYNVLQLINLPRQALIAVGDTIVTGGQSTIFPVGVPVGQIINIEKDNSYYSKIDIKLFNDMSNIGHVYLIKNNDQTQIKTLENSNKIE